jgi:hypothetical protein
MAYSASLIWEIRNTGSANNGGAFRGNPFQSPPATPAVAGSASGGTVTAGTYYVVITYTQTGFETPISGEQSVTLTGTTSSFTVTHPTDPGSSTTWNCYVGTVSGGPYFPQGTALAIGTNRVVTATPPTTGTQPAGIDYSQQNAAQVTYSDFVIGATNTTGTSAANPLTPALVGNVVNFTAGTGFTVQRAEILGVTAAGVATFDRALGTANSTGGTGYLGGAIAHPSTIAGVAVGGNVAFVWANAGAAVFTFTSSLTFSQSIFHMIGYDTTRTLANADANRPIFRAGANSLTLFNCNSQHRFANLVFDNPSAFTGLIGLQIGGNGVIHRCKFTSYQNWAVQLGGGSMAVDCEFVTCGSSNITVYMNGSSQCIRCIAKGCTSTGQGVFFMSATGCSLIDCISHGAVGTAAFSGSGYYQGCVAYGGTTNANAHGFVNGGSGIAFYERCVSYGNAGWGFTSSSVIRYNRLSRCFAGGNAAGNVNPAVVATDQLESVVVLTGDPFTNAAAYDFSLNNTAGAGAACKALSVTLPGGTTTSRPDAGAAQSTAAAAAGLIVNPGMGEWT